MDANVGENDTPLGPAEYARPAGKSVVTLENAAIAADSDYHGRACGIHGGEKRYES